MRLGAKRETEKSVAQIEARPNDSQIDKGYLSRCYMQKKYIAFLVMILVLMTLGKPIAFANDWRFYRLFAICSAWSNHRVLNAVQSILV